MELPATSQTSRSISKLWRIGEWRFKQGWWLMAAPIISALSALLILSRQGYCSAGILVGSIKGWVEAL
jgi:hypothetical protein